MSFLNRASFLKALDASAGWTLCKLLGRLRHWAHLPALFPTPDPSDIRRILVIRPGGIGDMLMLLPILQSFKDALPEVRIDIVCEKRNRDVLKLAGMETGALLYDARPFFLLRHLCSTRYDVAIDTEQFHNFSAVLALISGAAVRIGFRINPARLHLYTHLADYDVAGYETDQFLKLFQVLGINLPVRNMIECLSSAALPRAASFIGVAAPENGRLIALGPGASDHYKQWGPERFAELARRLLAAGHAIVLVGSRSDRSAARRTMAGLVEERFIRDATGTYSLERTAAILRQADLFIGCDSGLAHLAAALGVKTLAIFGPSDPRKWAAPDKNHAVIRKPLPCAPCAIFGYRKWCRETPCIGTISPDEVLSAALPLLG